MLNKEVRIKLIKERVKSFENSQVYVNELDDMDEATQEATATIFRKRHNVLSEETLYED